MRLAKSERERRIFEALAQLAGWEIAPNSISQPDPPDIVCEVTNLGHLGIELVAIDAEETRSRLDNMPNTEEAWHRALANCSHDVQIRLATENADAFFSIIFANDAGLRDRTRAMNAIQQFLLEHPNHQGAVPLRAVGRPSGLSSLIIHRGQVSRGPKFSHFSAGRWLPPQVSKLEAKLRPGRYKCEFPLELFAYAVHDEPDAAIGSLEGLQSTIVTLLPGSSFRRAHIFDLGFGRHLFSYPALC